jgi:hypothetical protein
MLANLWFEAAVDVRNGSISVLGFTAESGR